MFGVHIVGGVEPERVADVARLCDVTGAELRYNPCGEKRFEVWRDTTDRRDFNAFCRSVRWVLCEAPPRA